MSKVRNKRSLDLLHTNVPLTTYIMSTKPGTSPFPSPLRPCASNDCFAARSTEVHLKRLSSHGQEQALVVNNNRPSCPIARHSSHWRRKAMPKGRQAWGRFDGRQDDETTHAHVVPTESITNEHRQSQKCNVQDLPVYWLEQRRSALLVRLVSIGTGIPCRHCWTVHSRQDR